MAINTVNILLNVHVTMTMRADDNDTDAVDDHADEKYDKITLFLYDQKS